MVIIGSEGVMTPENGKVAIRSHTRGPVRLVDVVDQTPKAVTANAIGSAQDNETYKQYLAFANSLRTGQAPPVSPDDGKTAIKIVLLAEKSLRTNRVMNWTDLPA